MEEKGLISMDEDLIKFCVSWFSVRIANVGTKIAIESWNQHTLCGMCCNNNYIVFLQLSSYFDKVMTTSFNFQPAILISLCGFWCFL